MRCKALLAICLMIFSPAFVAEADEPKLRVEVVGSDGKPVKGGTITFESYGGEPVKKPTAGEVIVIKVLDQRAHMGSKVVMIPKTGSGVCLRKA